MEIALESFAKIDRSVRGSILSIEINMTKILKLLYRYGLYGGIRVAIDFIISKIIFPKALLIRRPFYVRTEGKLLMGRKFLSGPGLVIDVFDSGKLSIGDEVKVNAHVHIAVSHSVTIGPRVLIASGVFISDHSHGSYGGDNHTNPLIPPNDRFLCSKKVVIEEDCWIGEKVSILPGVHIGKGTIIGAGAVVTTNIPSYSIAVGIPARQIKKYDFDQKKWVQCTKSCREDALSV